LNWINLFFIDYIYDKLDKYHFIMLDFVHSFALDVSLLLGFTLEESAKCLLRAKSWTTISWKVEMERWNL